MSINFLNWAIGAIVASITFLSPISVSNHARTNEVMEEEAELTTKAPLWFEYNGVPFGHQDYGDEIKDPSNYTLYTGSTQPSCTGSLQVCAVLVTPDSSGLMPEDSALDELIAEFDDSVDSELIILKDATL